MEKDSANFRIFTFNELEKEYSDFINEAMKQVNFTFTEKVLLWLHPLFHRSPNYKSFALCSTGVFFSFCVLSTVIFMLAEAENYRNQTKLFQDNVQKKNEEFCDVLVKQYNLSQCDKPFVDNLLRQYRIFIFNNIDGLKTEYMPWSWNFHHTFGFTLWVFLSIGDGKMYPVTKMGRLACILLSTVGIPLFLLLTAYYGTILHNLFTFLYHEKFKNKFRRSARNSPKIISTGSSSSDTNTAGSSNLRTSIQQVQWYNLVENSVKTEKLNTPIVKEIDVNANNSDKLEISNIEKKVEQKQQKNPEIVTGKQTTTDIIKATEKSSRSPKKKRKDFNNKSSQTTQKGVSSRRPIRKSKYTPQTTRTPITQCPQVISSHSSHVLPMKIALVILLLYVVIGAVVLMFQIRDWDFFEAWYYIHITLFTIGFGDTDPWPVLTVIHYLYVFIGTSMVAMVLDSIKETFREKFTVGINKVFLPTTVVPIKNDLYLVPYNNTMKQTQKTKVYTPWPSVLSVGINLPVHMQTYMV